MLAANFSFYSVSHAQNNPQNTEQASGDKNALDPEFQKMLDESKQNQSATEPTLKDDVKVETIQPAQSAENNDKIKIPTYPKTTYEILAFISVGVLFLILNFVGSGLRPKLRYLFIGIPFDLGVKEEKTDAQRSVKSKRNIIELFLLLIVIGIFYYFATVEKRQTEENLLSELGFGAALTAVCYIFYIVIRVFWGLASKCPQCKNMFAVSSTSYDEPKTTFNEKSRGNSGKTQGHYVSVMESGLRHSDHSCSVCGHDWHTAKNYKKQLSRYFEPF